jgi:hypothetical protein
MPMPGSGASPRGSKSGISSFGPLPPGVLVAAVASEAAPIIRELQQELIKLNRVQTAIRTTMQMMKNEPGHSHVLLPMEQCLRDALPLAETTPRVLCRVCQKDITDTDGRCFTVCTNSWSTACQDKAIPKTQAPVAAQARHHRVSLQVTQGVNYKQERLPDRYKVFVVIEVPGSEPGLKESLELGSFQEALQAFINRL